MYAKRYMDTFSLALGATLLVSLVSLIGSVALSWNRPLLNQSLIVLIALAAGALIGDAAFHLIPEAVNEIGDERYFGVALLVGLMLFFVLERYLRWHHAHHGEEEDHTGHERYEYGSHASKAHIAPLVIVADALHNYIDGLIIAASFFISPPLGIATTVAVFLHEIPQEIADFALLVHSGLSRMKALLFNFASGLTALVGAATFFLLGELATGLTPYMSAFTAGAFLYIATADVVPELHKERGLGGLILQSIGFAAGIGIMIGLTFLEV